MLLEKCPHRRAVGLLYPIFGEDIAHFIERFRRLFALTHKQIIPMCLLTFVQIVVPRVKTGKDMRKSCDLRQLLENKQFGNVYKYMNRCFFALFSTLR